MEKIESNIEFLKMMSKQYPNVATVCTEITNLKAILNLPKGTEHFLTDLHGEYEAFTHVLKNASGVLRRKVSELFGESFNEAEMRSFLTLLYYPTEKLEIIKETEEDLEKWYSENIHRLIEICRAVSSKYSRSKVRKALPQDFKYVIEELLHQDDASEDKARYYRKIIETIIDIDRADEFIEAIACVIQRLAVDRLHIVGDVYDRGPGAHIIMDSLMKHHSLDIQWGNHDILWMGAACGSKPCIANVIRISCRYANMGTLEDGYGINLFPLATFALETYGEDPCLQFLPKTMEDANYRQKDLDLIAKMQKAITIIQFKLEGKVIKKNPEYEMDNRLLLDKIDWKDGSVRIDGESYKMKDMYFPTINPKDPYALTEDEKEVMEKLVHSFINSEKFQDHMNLMYTKGSMYLKYNSNLLYHACIPMNEDGSFKNIPIEGSGYKGKSLLDKCDELARQAFYNKEGSFKRAYARDAMWYMWCGENSPLFGKDKMTTFERYFIEDKKTHIEIKNSYYRLRDDRKSAEKILTAFGLDPETSHIVSGHVPVKRKDGESPIKADGKLLVIDGGFSKAYQSTTGIAGYTLIYNSYGLLLACHEPFESIKKAINEEKDMISTTTVLEKTARRKSVEDTDVGLELKKQIELLSLLLAAYRRGVVKQRKSYIGKD
jgi:fructose-1,6-bisphosphatase-3